MKHTCQSRHKDALLAFSAWAAAFVAASSLANPFNDGSSHILATDTNYNGTLYVGIQNPDNELLVIGGATVSATDVVVGQLTSSTNNSISVVGSSLLIAGSADTNGLTTGGVVVGSADEGAALSINNASQLNTDYLYVGFGANDSGTVALSGEESRLEVAQDALVGSSGSTNSIEIGDGAALSVGGTLNVGSVSSSNNTVNVASGGTLYVNATNNINVVNTDDDNGIAIAAAGTLQVGGDVNTGTLAGKGITLAKKANLEVGGSLTVDKNRIDNSLNVILNNDLSTNTAAWSSSALTVIGSTSADNSLTFTNGATGHALNIVQIGQQTTAARNELNVGGSNSVFTADTDVFVGAQGKNNQLNVNDNGLVDVAGNLYLGNDATATGNAANIGSNGTLSVSGNVLIGDIGAGNKMNIDHGTVDVGGDILLGKAAGNNRYNQTGGTNTVAGAFIIGKTANATGKTGFVNDDAIETTGNLALIGEDATLDIGQDLTVGLEGGGSIMAIRDGGTVNVAGDVVIGESVGDNYIYLQRGSNTAFNVTGDLVVGKEGGSNRFATYGGTANIGGDLFLGATTNEHDVKNFIHLETTNAVLNVANAVYIGASNSLNTLDLVDGATLNTTDLFVGTHDGVSNNVVTVSGEDSLLMVSDILGIGSATASNNSVVVENGGILNVDQTNIVLGAGSNNILQIADGGTLKVTDWDYALVTGTATNIAFDSGSTLHLLGMLSGTNEVSGSRSIVLDGTNALWDSGTNALYVGNSDANNSLTITNGAMAVTSTNLLIGYASDNNTVTVGGAGSVLNVGSDLLIGNETNTSAYYNSLVVLDGGSVSVGGDLRSEQAGTLRISANSQVHVAGNYEQTYNERYQEGSKLEIGVSSNQVAPNLLVDGTANLQSGTTLSVFNDGLDKNDTNVVRNVVVSGALTIDDQTATTGLLLDNLNIETNLLLGFSITVSNGTTIVLDNFIVRTLGEAAGLSGQLLDIANEIETISSPEADSMLAILDGMDGATANRTMENYYGERVSSIPAHNAINMGIHSVAEQLTKRSDNTRARMAAARTTMQGAQGPHMEGQELQGWITGFKTWTDRSSDSGFDGYDGNINGFLVGADLSVAEGILFGVAGGTGSSSLDKKNGAAIDTDTAFGSLYASAGTMDWFMDSSLIFGRSSVDAVLGDVFDTTASYDAQNLAIYLGGGKEIIGNYLIITPQASLLGNYYSQDSYDETSTTAVARKVGSFDTLYIQSAVGCNVGFYSNIGDMTVKPEFRAFWLHEFNAQDESLPFTLIGGTGSYNMLLQAPESDIIKLGGGVSARLGEYLELRADLDTRMASGYSDYTLLGSIRYQF